MTGNIKKSYSLIKIINILMLNIKGIESIEIMSENKTINKMYILYITMQSMRIHVGNISNIKPPTNVTYIANPIKALVPSKF